MKKILPIILLLTAITTQAQKLSITSVELRIKDCRQDSYYDYKPDTIAFYRLPNDTLVFMATRSRLSDEPVLLNNIPVASYRLVFKNKFGQTVNKQVNLKSKPSNIVTICTDSLQSYEQNTLSQLQLGDSIVINFTSQGCFHWAMLKLVVTKEAKCLVAKLYKTNGHTFATKGKRQKLIEGPVLLKTTVLNQQQVSAFTRFENELNWVGNGGCTTTDYYEIESKYWSTKKKDGSCHWRGFDYLRQSFFGKEK